MSKKSRRVAETYNKGLDKEKDKRNDSTDLQATSSRSWSPPPPHSIEKRKTIENVLILQGGGSLGAFGCGVFKALVKGNIKIDIIAGTSIGAVNAAIIAGSKNEDTPEQLLEQFWLELSKSFVDLNNTATAGPYPFAYPFLPSLAEQVMDYLYNYYPYSFFGRREIEGQDYPQSVSRNQKPRIKQIKSFYSSAIFGNDKMFKPRWKPEYAISDPEYFTPEKWTYLYDHSPLARTLDKYIDYKKLNPNGKPNARLIITATNVLTAEPLVFDSSKQQITPKHILGASGYPSYNFPWVEVEKDLYAWDGSLLSNTPLREAIDASPVNDKRIFLVENYPKKIDVLPRDLPEVHHRARDIIFSDKTEHNVVMSKVITRYLQYIEELYQIVEQHANHQEVGKERLKKIRYKYKKYKQERGAEIKQIFYISRDEPFPHIYENADFSPETIKNSIEEGEEKTDQALRKIG
ncbi:MAG: patatin-like phospholipase family protein [Thermoproteota archaeon]|nr:patatin-like phospholipase family protein [Thermoproteota archaeon]